MVFERNEGNFESGRVGDSGPLITVERCSVAKKEFNECVLKVEPTAHIELSVMNSEFGEWLSGERIELSLSNGFYDWIIPHNGPGSSQY